MTQTTALVLPANPGNLPACLIIARYHPDTGARMPNPDGGDTVQLCL